MSIKVCLQMHSVREYMHVNPLGAIVPCRNAGYHYLELPLPCKNDLPGFLYGKTAIEWKRAAKDAGAILTGGYIALNEEYPVESQLDFYAELGASRVIIPIDYFPDHQTLAYKCSLYNTLGQLAAQRNMHLLYENHYHEFQILDGRTIFEQLLANTDPEFFSISLNTYWLMRGLIEPLSVITTYGSRIRTIVQQDYPLSEIDKFNMWSFNRYHPIAKNIQFENILQGNEIENIHPVQCELFCEIGDGILALQPIIDYANELKCIDYVVLKQDYTRMESEFDSIAKSAKNYQHVRGVIWE